MPTTNPKNSTEQAGRKNNDQINRNRKDFVPDIGEKVYIKTLQTSKL